MVSHFLNRNNIALPFFLAWGITFMGVILMRILFVSTNINDAFIVIKTMFDFDKFNISQLLANHKKQALLCFIGFIITVAAPNTNQISEKFKTNTKYLIITLLLIVLALLSMNKVAPFLYFQF